MHALRRIAVASLAAAVLAGCGAPKVDYAKIQKPARSADLDVYNVFVGTWDWKAEIVNAADPADKNWSGMAAWEWALDNRALHGMMEAHSERTKFEAAGLWTVHPKSGKYMWWMFNNWGYPQEGSARYDAETKTWTMQYTSVGLDGTTSHGEYTMKVVNPSLLDWHMTEWADGLHMVKKIEMNGTYTKKSDKSPHGDHHPQVEQPAKMHQ
jgi:hypothetical protein